METTMYVVIANNNAKDDPEIVKFGTEEECEAYLFNIIRPSSLTSNLKQIDCDNGYSLSIEEMERGEWRQRIFHLRRVNN